MDHPSGLRQRKSIQFHIPSEHGRPALARGVSTYHHPVGRSRARSVVKNSSTRKFQGFFTSKLYSPPSVRTKWVQSKPDPTPEDIEIMTVDELAIALELRKLSTSSDFRSDADEDKHLKILEKRLKKAIEEKPSVPYWKAEDAASAGHVNWAVRILRLISQTESSYSLPLKQDLFFDLTYVGTGTCV